jgi:hypothetical protein
MLRVSLDCPFLIVPSVFSNIYYQHIALEWDDVCSLILVCHLTGLLCPRTVEQIVRRDSSAMRDKSPDLSQSCSRGDSCWCSILIFNLVRRDWVNIASLQLYILSLCERRDWVNIASLQLYILSLCERRDWVNIASLQLYILSLCDIFTFGQVRVKL